MSKFTESETAGIVGGYSDAVAAGFDYDQLVNEVKTIAKSFDVSVPVIRGVLVAAKVYVAKPKASPSTDNTAGGMDKAAIVKAIGAIVGKDVPSFEKATKKDLTVFWDWMVLASNRSDADA